jgi:uncharacterized membrane protein YoaK (UPF0700 family)
MILLLAVAGGSVDVIIIQGFGVLTAAQTGNTILLAVAIARHNLGVGLSAAVSVAGYIVGAAIGEMVIVRQHGSGSLLFRFSRTLVAELIPLSGLLACWLLARPKPAFGTIAVLVALAAIAMGIQSAAVLRLHLGPTTTYVTGTLATFSMAMVQRLHLIDEEPILSPLKHDLNFGRLFSDRNPWTYGLTWIVYLTGAAIGGLLFLRVAELALLLPIAAIIAVIMVDAFP